MKCRRRLPRRNLPLSRPPALQALRKLVLSETPPQSVHSLTLNNPLAFHKYLPCIYNYLQIPIINTYLQYICLSQEFLISMAPSAISAEQPAGNEIKSKSKDESVIEHVHDAEDLTPLQAISHNWESGLVIGGTYSKILNSNSPFLPTHHKLTLPTQASPNFPPSKRNANIS